MAQTVAAVWSYINRCLLQLVLKIITATMSAKFLQGISDDPQVEKEIQKQIGCMAGFLQLFDRHQILTGKKLYGPKRLAAARSNTQNVEPTASSNQLEQNETKDTQETSHDLSMLSRTSSMDYSEQTRNAEDESETELKDLKSRTDFPKNSSSSSAHEASRYSLDIRDVVRDSFQSKTCPESKIQTKQRSSIDPTSVSSGIHGLSSNEHRPSKTPEEQKSPAIPRTDAYKCRKETTIVPIFECRDAWRSSARHRELPRLSLDSRACIDQRSRLFNDEFEGINDKQSLIHGLAPNKKEPQKMAEEKRGSPSVVARLMGLGPMPLSQKRAELTRSVSESRICYDMPRFRCTEDSSGNTHSNSDNKHAESFQKRFDSAGFLIPKSKKLHPLNGNVAEEKGSETAEQFRQRNPSSVKQTKQRSVERYPVEAAPWNFHSAANFERWNSFPEHRKSSSKIPDALYGDLVKKLQQTGAGNELDALKEVLEAIQLKRLVYSQQDGDRDTYQNHQRKIGPVGQTRNPNSCYPSKNRGRIEPKERNMHGAVLRSFESDMKPPAKFSGHAKPPRPTDNNRRKGGYVSPQASCRGHNSRKASHACNNTSFNRFGNEPAPTVKSRRERIVNEALPIFKEPVSKSIRSPVSPPRSSQAPSAVRSSSPPPKQRILKSEIEKRAKNVGTLVGKERYNRKGLPGVLSPRPGPARQVNNRKSGTDRSSRVSASTLALKVGSETEPHDFEPNSIMDMASDFSESNRSNMSHVDLEKLPVSKTGDNENWEADNKYRGGQEFESPEKSLLTIEILEQPSPVSVLDSSVYKDDGSPPPITRRSINFTENKSSGGVSFELGDLKKLGCSRRDCLLDQQDVKNTPASQKILEVVVDSSSELDKMSWNVNNSNVEYCFIVDILQFSGLLKDTETYTVTFHSSGYPVDPQLFHDLKQKYSNPSFTNTHKGFRSSSKLTAKNIDFGLIFDTVNDILHKLLSPYLQLSSFRKIWHKRPSGNQLLQQVWEGFESLPCIQSEDMYENLCTIITKDLAQRTNSWSDTRLEYAGLVLDIERMLFKDLIDETISDLRAFSCRYGQLKSSAMPRHKL
eukprot:TRINITY_DN8075_c0_g1_i1.p1 TRINITY_DN8075_c0_g1~~TRINITY_DN8075_c0_g1_i1.p1  ORF type:complete len:1083 (+),score=257.88 TRINITY_DN8075_c0_g1_i1:264-3512(+)